MIVFLLIINEGMAQFVTKFAELGDSEYGPPVQKGETPVRCYTSAVFNSCSCVFTFDDHLALLSHFVEWMARPLVLFL